MSVSMFLKGFVFFGFNYVLTLTSEDVLLNVPVIQNPLNTIVGEIGIPNEYTISLNTTIESEINDEQILIAQHKNVANGYFSRNAKNTFLENENNPNANTYSIIGNLNANDYKYDDDTWHFKLIYHYNTDPDDIIIWKQYYWILTDIDINMWTTPGKETVFLDGSAINTKTGCDKFWGLGISGDAVTMLDGNGKYGCWWNAIGSYAAHAGGIPGFNNKVAYGMELYIFKRNSDAIINLLGIGDGINECLPCIYVKKDDLSVTFTDSDTNNVTVSTQNANIQLGVPFDIQVIIKPSNVTLIYNNIISIVSKDAHSINSNKTVYVGQGIPVNVTINDLQITAPAPSNSPSLSPSLSPTPTPSESPTPTPSLSPTAAPKDKIISNPNNETYFRGPIKMNFLDSYYYCKKEGSILASIIDDIEQNKLYEACGNDDCWIGYSNIGGRWKYINDISNGYTNWAINKPNDCEWEQCAQLWKDHNGKWNNQHCFDDAYPLCNPVGMSTSSAKSENHALILNHFNANAKGNDYLFPYSYGIVGVIGSLFCIIMILLSYIILVLKKGKTALKTNSYKKVNTFTSDSDTADEC